MRWVTIEDMFPGRDEYRRILEDIERRDMTADARFVERIRASTDQGLVEALTELGDVVVALRELGYTRAAKLLEERASKEAPNTR